MLSRDSHHHHYSTANSFGLQPPKSGFRSNLIHSSWLLAIQELSVLTDSTVLHYYRWRNYCVESRPVLLELLVISKTSRIDTSFVNIFENYFQIEIFSFAWKPKISEWKSPRDSKILSFFCIDKSILQYIMQSLYKLHNVIKAEPSKSTLK